MENREQIALRADELQHVFELIHLADIAVMIVVNRNLVDRVFGSRLLLRKSRSAIARLMNFSHRSVCQIINVNAVGLNFLLCNFVQIGVTLGV